MTDDLSQVTEDSARGGFFLFSGTALASVILAISVVLLGRFLGPELYGQYSLVLVIPGILALFTDLGMSAGVTKFVANLRSRGNDKQAATIISHGLLFRLIIGCAISVLGAVFASYCSIIINRPDLVFYIQIVAFSLVFQSIFNLVNSAFVGLDKSEYFALTSNVQSIFRTISQVALVLLGFGISGALIGYVGGFVVASIFGVALLFFKFLRNNRASEALPTNSYSSSLKLLARYGLPVYVSVVLVGFFPLYQQLILAFFVSDTAIGNFRAAYNFAMLLTIILTAISTALLPAFSKLEASLELVNAFFKRANKYATLLMVPITTLVVLFSNPIVQFLYGPVYSSAPLYLSLSCLLYFLVGIGYLTLTSVFNGLGKTRLTLYVTLINFAILIGLSPIFAQAYGVEGVIVAYLLAGTVASLYAAYVAVKKLKITFDFSPLLRIYLISMISSFPSLALLFFASLSSLLVLILGLFTYAVLYITLMPLMHVIDIGELKELARITGRIPLLKLITGPLFKYQRRLLFLKNTSELA